MTDPDYAALKAKLADRDWRISNLYFVRNKAGNKERFSRWAAQKQYWAEQWFLNVIVKARQLGLSTEIVIEMLDACLFNSNTRCGIIDRTITDAKKKLDIVKFAYVNLPQGLQDAIPVIRGNTEEMEWGNGSSIGVGTSHRGGTLQILHVSEFGPIALESPDKAREIIKGAFNTVARGQMIHVESTPAGTGGDFHDMVQQAEGKQKQGRELSQLEFRLHFFPWHQEQQYRDNPNTVVITSTLAEYFDELEKKSKIKLDPAQRAFYAAKYNLLGPDDILEEFPSTLEECFKSSIEGAFFKREMMKMRSDGRVGPMPHDPSRKVNTFWDIGHHDPNFIIFHQTDGVRHRIIDCYENDGEGLSHCVSVLRERKEKFGYDYGTHYGPHDLGETDWSVDDNKSRKDIAASKGIEFTVVPRIAHKGDAIEAARRMLNMTWIDEVKAARLIQCLDNYRKEWDEARGVWKREPLHNWAGHGADSYMTGAMGFEPEIKSRRSRDSKSSGASPWAA